MRACGMAKHRSCSQSRSVALGLCTVQGNTGLTAGASAGTYPPMMETGLLSELLVLSQGLFQKFFCVGSLSLNSFLVLRELSLLIFPSGLFFLNYTWLLHQVSSSRATPGVVPLLVMLLPPTSTSQFIFLPVIKNMLGPLRAECSGHSRWL